MRTTIDLPDALGRQVKSRAALAGLSIRSFVTQALERQLAAGRQTDATPATGELPVIRSRKPGSLRLTPDEVSALLVHEEAEAYATAMRR